jgi:hypothetical protein
LIASVSIIGLGPIAVQSSLREGALRVEDDAQDLPECAHSVQPLLVCKMMAVDDVSILLQRSISIFKVALFL